ncbi:VMAP-C domain-containing protein [Actinacidiphila acidipaludis]|uniref:Zorya protein ZorC EH domain-containing protein n=1 Tax=Actinacidiphila acidipaludis TaxID=2873382 RepID=A0ABS7Q2R0_9ACTN|nr:hypothetical protein [Streptomyces acidipaludis]MBY8877024.1 hypothetical protein [Streptomyces acidipaludis]
MTDETRSPGSTEGTSPTLTDLQQDLLTRLTDAPALTSPAGSRALLRLVARDPQTGLDDMPDTAAPPRVQLHQLVLSCTTRTDRADALADALDAVTGGPETAIPLRAMSDLLAARQWLGSGELDGLQRLVERTAVPDVQAVAQASLQPLAGTLPQHCTDAWPAVLHLLRRNVLPSGLPPFLAFMEYLAAAARGPAETTRQLRDWTERKASEWQVLTELHDCRAAADAQPVRRSAAARVMFVFLPDGLLNDYYTLRTWHREAGAEGAPTLRDDDKQIGQRDIPRTVYQRLQQWGRQTGTSVRNLTVEFFLPLPLLNQPVWEWCRSANDPAGLSRFDVVVRSLERLQTPTLHSKWRDRWATLQDPAAADPGAGEDTAPEETSRRHVVVLSAPPTLPKGRTELMDAIRSGAPAILWHRLDCGSTAFRASVRRLIDQGPLKDLPQRVSALHADAGTAPVGEETDAVRDITLLWDDPDHTLPSMPALVPPGEAKAS